VATPLAARYDAATMSRASESLMELYEAMRARWGHRAWWPSRAGADTPEGKLEIAVGAVLTQNTNWRNVEKAVENLRGSGALSIAALHAMPHKRLAELIRPAGYFNVKAKRLKNFAAAVHEAFGDNFSGFLDRSAATLREDLLSVNGIGRETADSIVLYAAGKLSFVVDAYTYRILLRHRLIAPEDDYEAIQELFEGSLPDDVALWNDYHAQLVETGKVHCRPRARCEGCPLERFPHDPDAGREAC
jgi:endonuclease-3 related protein